LRQNAEDAAIDGVEFGLGGHFGMAPCVIVGLYVRDLFSNGRCKRIS